MTNQDVKPLAVPQTQPGGTRERLVTAAMRMFHEHGYHATGLADVLKEAGVRSGSLYYFFESKEALLAAVLDHYTELLWPVVMQPVFDTVPDPLERVFEVLNRYRQMLLVTNFSRGCPIGNLALEIGDSKPAVREKIASNFARWCEAIEKCLDEAADRFPADLDRKALSRFVLTVMEGGIMQSRACQSVEPYDASVKQFRDLLMRIVTPEKR